MRLLQVHAVKQLAILCSLILGGGCAYGAEGVIAKAECDAALTAEITRLEDSFSRTRVAWEQTVERRFQEHATELTDAQMNNARATFDDLVLKISHEHVKAVALPGLYRMMLTVPRYDIDVCSKPEEMRNAGNKAITGFLMKLTELLPMIERTVLAAKADS